MLKNQIDFGKKVFLYLDKIWQKTGIPENLRPVIIWAEWQDRINKSKRR